MDVAVLTGGRSPEHDISLSSTEEVMHHLDRKRWRVWPVFLDRVGQWWPSARPLQANETWNLRDHVAKNRAMRPGAAVDWLLDHGIDVVLPVLHGPHGEDGTVQGMLELHDLPCVGSGCAASAVAMDKLRTRQALHAAGVPLAPAYEPTTSFRTANAAVEFARMRATIGVPAFVKVDASGSTVGVQRIETAAQLEGFFATFRGSFRRWFAERAVEGEEITVAVLGNTGDKLQPLPPVGIYPRCDSWFTHKAKYDRDGTEEVIPPRGLSTHQIAEVQALAVRCHEALVCDGMSRTDMIVTADGPIVLEVNTIPGLTKTSLLPQAARAAGFSFPALLDRLLDLALARVPDERRAPRERPDAPPESGAAAASG